MAEFRIPSAINNGSYAERVEHARMALTGENAEQIVTGIDRSMTWDETPQGHEYWDTVCDGLRRGGPLPLEAAMYLRQLLEALEAQHE